MTKVIDLVLDDDLRRLAARSNVRLGSEIVRDGEVAFGAFKPELIEATVTAPGLTTRRTRLELKDGDLSWKCTCTSDSKLFCKHLVATALAAQREGRGDIYKAAGIIIKDGKMLVERSVGKPAFIGPGGRIEPGETPKQALVRELREEFGIEVDEADLEPFGRFSADAANHPGQQVHMDAFVVKKWRGEIMLGAEVEEIMWLGAKLPDDVELGSIFAHDILPKLVQEGRIR